MVEGSSALDCRIESLERTISEVQGERVLAARLMTLFLTPAQPEGVGVPDRIVEIGRRLLPADFVSLVAPAESASVFECLAAVGCDEGPFRGRRWAAASESALVAAVEGREPVACIGRDQVQFSRVVDRSLVLRSALHVPVLEDGDVAAVLTFGKRGPGRMFEPAEVAAAGWLAAWAGLLLGWARDRQRAQALESRLQAQHAQMLHTEKLKSLGQLVSGVAHELNNPLTAVLGRAGLIERAESLAEAQRQAGKIREAASRAAKIAKGLSTFARSHPADRGPMNLNDLVRWATDFQEYQLAVDNIKVETDLDPGLPAIIGDHHELEQVLINLMLNAQHAMVTAQGSGALRLATRWAGEWVELRVEDDGPGIPPEVLPRIFDAFFTTKPVGEGTGLGLSIVQEIVTRHGGKVRVEPPESGKGTIVIVALPPMRSATAQKS